MKRLRYGVKSEALTPEQRDLFQETLDGDQAADRGVRLSNQPRGQACRRVPGELACLTHARRKFYELYAANQSPIAKEVLARIGRLYEIEARGLDLGAAATETAADGSGKARAIDYSLKCWEALCRYADSGDLPIDINLVENAIRPIAIGKKNWLFAGSERAGKCAAAIQSLFGTARLNGLDPYA